MSSKVVAVTNPDHEDFHDRAWTKFFCRRPDLTRSNAQGGTLESGREQTFDKFKTALQSAAS